MGTDRQTWSSPSLSLTFYLMLAILLTTVPIICMTSFVDYAGVRQELDKDTTLLQDQTEKSIVLSMDLWIPAYGSSTIR
jgi:two-component system, NarL family, sensor histidine kinase BarA